MNTPRRPAWVEIDVAALRQNWQHINADKPEQLSILAVVKDDAYGHGAVTVAHSALAAGAVGLAVSNLAEAAELRQAGIQAPVLVFGMVPEGDWPWCLEKKLTFFVNSIPQADALQALCERQGVQALVQTKINTGMNRYGVRWSEALPVLQHIAAAINLQLEGIMSHFSMSDELDKTYANLQLSRFQELIAEMETANQSVKYRHHCNTGGYLDLPQAHFDLVRLGILPLGVYPSQVCRRIPGMQPVMSVKTRIAQLQTLQPGDKVGYGMRYEAKSERRIAVLPIGYGDGYPRVRNEGHVLIAGKRAPIIGGLAMDAMMVDVSEIPAVNTWDEVVLMGKQGAEEIDVHEIAALKGSVSYDILTGWRHRLPRVVKSGHAAEKT